MTETTDKRLKMAGRPVAREDVLRELGDPSTWEADRLRLEAAQRQQPFSERQRPEIIFIAYGSGANPKRQRLAIVLARKPERAPKETIFVAEWNDLQKTFGRKRWVGAHELRRFRAEDKRIPGLLAEYARGETVLKLGDLL